MTWHEAQENCVAWGGHLVSVETAAAITEVDGLTNFICGDVGYWIGYNDLAEEGAWVWNDGTAPTSNLNWAAGEPNNWEFCPSGGGEDVAEAYSSGQWNDLCYNATNPCYVCEKPAQKSCIFTENPDCCEVDGECDDANDCTLDVCVNNNCVHAPQAGEGCCQNATECDDGDSCTIDICLATGVCSSTPSDDCCLPGSTETCFTANGFGTCSGVRTCLGGDIWSDCNALVPSEEICDGIDNDCNPETVCFTFHHNGEIYQVEPIQGETGVVSFYAYDEVTASANTGYETDERSSVLLYRDFLGNVTMLLIHDANGFGFGLDGQLSAIFDGAQGMEILIYDDDLGGNDDWEYNQAAGTGSIDWTYGQCCTDGIGIGYLTGEFCLNFTFSSVVGEDGLTFHDGTGFSFDLEDGIFDFSVCGAP